MSCGTTAWSSAGDGAHVALQVLIPLGNVLGFRFV